MQKNLSIVLGSIVVLVVCVYALNAYIYNQKQADSVTNFKDAVYVIGGKAVQLTDGFAQTQAAPDSASKVTTRYFGNELVTDLDGDGIEDVAFVLTQETGGSGVYYYAVGAVKTEQGYEGTDGYLLGDRVAPQSTDISPNPRHKNVVVFNYADRNDDEPMTTPPSVGESVYLKVVPQTLRWAIVEPDFEGETNKEIRKEETASAITAFNWNIVEREVEPTMVESEVFVVVTYADGTSNQVLVDTITGSCNEEPVETTLALDSEQITCYYAGLGHKFRVVEDQVIYVVEQRTSEEALPTNEGERLSEFETKLTFEKE